MPLEDPGKEGRASGDAPDTSQARRTVVDVLIHAGSPEPGEVENTHSGVWAVFCLRAEGLVPSPRSRLARGSSLAGAIFNPFTLPLQKGHGVAKYQPQFLGNCKLVLSRSLLILTDITQSSLCTFLHLGQNPACVLLYSRRFGHV